MSLGHSAGFSETNKCNDLWQGILSSSFSEVGQLSKEAFALSVHCSRMLPPQVLSDQLALFI